MAEIKNNLLDLLKKAAENKKENEKKVKTNSKPFKFDEEKARAFLEKYKKND